MGGAWIKPGCTRCQVDRRTYLDDGRRALVEFAEWLEAAPAVAVDAHGRVCVLRRRHDHGHNLALARHRRQRRVVVQELPYLGVLDPLLHQLVAHRLPLAFLVHRPIVAAKVILRRLPQRVVRERGLWQDLLDAWRRVVLRDKNAFECRAVEATHAVDWGCCWELRDCWELVGPGTCGSAGIRNPTTATIS